MLDGTLAFEIGTEDPLNASNDSRNHYNINYLLTYNNRYAGTWQCDIPDDVLGQNYLRLTILASEFLPDDEKI